jgi:outer membrane cobalamin receptor
VGGQVASVVEVSVNSRVDGDPIPRALVSLPESGLSSLTDRSGRAVLRGLPPGLYRLTVQALGYGEEAVEVEAVNGRRTYASVSLSPDPLELRGLEVAAETGDLPPGGIVVTREELGPTVKDLPEALDGLPGVTMVRRGSEGSSASIQIRGSSPGQVLVLLDGVPLNSPLTGEVDLSGIHLTSLDRIVVRPGANSARYGPRALAGVVLLESRRPTESSADLSLGVGSWGSRSISGGGSWTPASRWTLSARGNWNTADGDFLYDVPEFRGGGKEERENAWFHRKGGNLGVERRRGSSVSSLRVHGSELERGSPGPTAQPALAGEQSHGRSGVSLRHQMGGSERGVSGMVALQWQRAEYSDSMPPLGQAYDQRARVAQQELGLAGWRRFGPALGRVGGELRRRAIEADVLMPPFTEVQEAGLWAQLELDRPLGKTARGRLNLGVRADGHGLVDGLRLSPSLSASYDNRGARIEVAFRSAFSPPDLADLFFQEGVLVRPNPDLRPERVRGEITVTADGRVQLGKARIQGRISAYQSDIDDMVLWFPDFRFVWSPKNFDVSRRGIEVGSVVEFPLLGRDHSLSGQGAWAHVDYQGGVLHGQIAYRPVFTANGEGRFDLAFGNLTFRANHVGSRRAVAGSDLNSLSPYTILDLGWSSTLTLGAVSGRIEVVWSNLLDDRAALLVDYPLPSRGWSTHLHLTPATRK